MDIPCCGATLFLVGSAVIAFALYLIKRKKKK